MERDVEVDYDRGEVNLLFNVTINNISVIHVTAHTCCWCSGGRKKKYLDLRSGSQRHRHFVGFFNVPVQAPIRDHPFYTVIPTHRPNESSFTTCWGYGGHILDLIPRVFTGDYDRSQTRVCVGLLRVKKILGGCKKGATYTCTTAEERIGYRNLERIYIFPCILGREIRDSENKNGHAWLWATRFMQLVELGGVG